MTREKLFKLNALLKAFSKEVTPLQLSNNPDVIPVNEVHQPKVLLKVTEL